MREIWRKTAELFWEWPILWVPVLCAGFLSFWLLWSEEMLARKLIAWLVPKPSVLSVGSIPLLPPDPAWVRRALMISRPLELSAYFLVVCLYVMAFILTAKLVGELNESSRADFSSVFGTVRSRLRRILVFCVKMIFLIVVAAALVMFGLTAFVIRFARVSPDVLGYGDVLLIEITVALVLTPQAILLLRDHPSGPVLRKHAWCGRGFSIAAVVAVVTIEYFLRLAQHRLILLPIFAGVIPQMLLSVIDSLVPAFPYIPLFIALSLVEKGDAAEAEVVTIGADG